MPACNASEIEAHVLSAALALALALPRRRYGASPGSPHDFTAQGWSRRRAVRRLPHAASRRQDRPQRAPWNHRVTTATYTLYSSPTLKATLSQPTHYGSKLCLSCHDGTVALDSFGGNTRSTTFIDTANSVGTDLRGTHPIGLIYDAALSTADPELYNPATKLTALGGTITHDLLFGTGTWSARPVTTSTIRETTLPSSASRRTEARICLTCHNK